MSGKKSQKEKSLSQSEYELLADFRYAVRQFIKFSETAAEAVGLTSNQHQALLAVKGFPSREVGITNGELAERLQIKHHSAVGLVNRLEAQNLVVRKKSDADKREVYVFLTPRGEKLLEQLTAVHREELQNLAPQLTGVLANLKKAK
ncbi:MAG: MarR family winged helix-turn-helix transcriptional regulator [Pyrinomonadaceae bacterium]